MDGWWCYFLSYSFAVTRSVWPLRCRQGPNTWKGNFVLLVQAACFMTILTWHFVCSVPSNTTWAGGLLVVLLNTLHMPGGSSVVPELALCCCILSNSCRENCKRRAQLLSYVCLKMTNCIVNFLDGVLP